MEENNNNQTSEIKKETKEAVNEVKNTFKGANFKDEALNAKNFFLNFIKSPIATVKEASSGNGNNIIIAVILLAVLVIANVLGDVIFYGFAEYLEITAKVVVLDILSPVIFVAVFSLMTYVLGGKDKKSINTIVTAIMIALTPYVIKSVIYIVYALINEALSIGFIFSMISSTITFITMVLLMKTIKELITKTGDEEKDFRKIILIVFVSYAIVYVLDKLEIYSAF